MTEECKLCGGVGRVVILVPNVAPEKGKVYSDCPCCIERIWTADEAKLNARIAELEAQQAVLVEALTEYMAAYNEHWERGMPILEPMGDAALAAVKPTALINGLTEAETNTTASVAGLAARKTCVARGFMFGNDDACWFYCVGGGCGSDEPCEHQLPAGQKGSE